MPAQLITSAFLQEKHLNEAYSMKIPSCFSGCFSWNIRIVQLRWKLI